MLVEEKRTPRDQAADLTGAVHNLEKVLPLSAIRQHTKTDDIPTVTDFMLEIYRKAALEAAEKYTGLLVQERRVFMEEVKLPGAATSRNLRTNFFYHTVKTPFALPLAYFYGHRNEPPVQIPVIVGDRKAKLPLIIDDFGINSCCNPCAAPVTSRLMYSGGFDCEASIPAAVALGALKYIAHVIENPGDVAYANRPSGEASDGAAVDRVANPAWASGAIEIWRSCVDNAI